MRRSGVTSFEQNPTFLAVHPEEPYLFVVHEVADGNVTSFRIDDDGTLSKVNTQSSGSSGPCHCSVHPSGKFLIVAHYTGAAVSVLPIGIDGQLEAVSDVAFHQGSGPVSDRQSQAHPHSATPGPNGKFLYVPDLGTDKVVVYEFDSNVGSLERIGCTAIQPGAGPRHLTFHPSEPEVYLINELDSTVSAYQWDEHTGELTTIDTKSTVPTEFEGHNLTSEIRVHPSGNWLYGANRGHDSIAVFDIRDNRTLTFVETVSTGGTWPRHFTLDPQGGVLFAENKNSNSIVAFRINEFSGRLHWADTTLEVPEPVCMQFVTQSVD